MEKNAGIDAVEWHEQIAASFDAGYDRSPAFRERLAVWQQLIAKHVHSDDLVLDAGCGSGVFSLLAAARARHVRGIDGSAAMIALCRRAQADRAVDNISFDQAMLATLDDAGDASFDVILSSSVLEYVPDYLATLDNLARLLRPGGRLLLSMPNGRSWYRKVERGLFGLTGWPRYYRHVVNVPTAELVAQHLQSRGLRVLETDYFADPPSFAGQVLALLSPRHRKTLFVQVAVKDR